jgi:hypothetical protein
LTLQTAVVSASEESLKLSKKCVTQTVILKMYSLIILVTMTGYYFITDKNFLAQYGFDDILADVLGGLNSYMSIIGFS